MNYFQQLHDLCTKMNVSVSTAESCTSGLLASKITSFSGASSFFKGGIISYQNDIKVNVLGVSELLIKDKIGSLLRNYLGIIDDFIYGLCLLFHRIPSILFFPFLNYLGKHLPRSSIFLYKKDR